MDPFSGEGELLNISTAFYTHAYNEVINFDTTPLSSQNKATAQILKYRSQIALGQSNEVITTLKSSNDAASKSIIALAEHSLGKTSGLEKATQLAESDPEDAVVQICASIILASSGEYTTAIDLLGKHQGSLEAVALLTQIHLLQNRTDLAIKEVQSAKRWAQDSLLINLAESWVNLRLGGKEKYQNAFYVYEELANTPSNTSPTSLIGQAVSELLLGRVEEAEAALQLALDKKDPNVEALSNSVVLASVTGKKIDVVQGLIDQLRKRDENHALILDLQEKNTAFDTAAAKYSAKVS